MHIGRIAIRNFRNFESIDLQQLNSGVVLVGENGSGKSNFLEALRLVLDPSLPETARHLSADDFWDGLDGPFGGHEIQVVVELEGFDSDPVAKAVLGEYLVSMAPHRARLTYLYRPIERDGSTSAAGEAEYEAVVFGGLDEASRVRRSDWRFVSMRVLPALRDAETRLRSAQSPLRRLVDRVDLSATSLADIAVRIDEAAALLTDGEELAALAASISTRLEEMVGGAFSVPTALGVVSTHPDGLLRSMRLFIDEERRRGIDQASLGTANLLYLTLLLEDIGAQRAAGEVAELVLAVEEPEAHLHPHVQRVLFRHLLAADGGLVVTTHSPHIASVTPLSSIVLLRQEENASSAFRADLSVFSEAETADIERYLDVTRAEMLFARAVILVEGIAEQYLIPAFAVSLGLDLDAHGVTVCSVHGTNFAPYVRLLGKSGLSVPFVVLTDGDPDSDGVPVGLQRASGLLDDPSVTEAIDDRDFATARSLSASQGIMVGSQTLELDLLSTASDQMATAYGELEQSKTKRNNFRAELADGQSKKVLRRIEEVGKGRFAQRLAGHVDGVDPPAHIDAALRRIADLVGADLPVRGD